MNESAPQHSRQTRVAELDRLLERDPDAIEARYERAGLLRELGVFEAAKRDYLELIRHKPDDFGVLNDFGTAALDAGYGSAARSLFEEAVRRHPDNPMGRVNLANLLLLMEEHELARTHFEAALQADPAHIHAHRGLGNLLEGIGDAEGARRHRDLGFCKDFITALPYRGAGTPVRVLLLISAMGGNTPTASLLDDSVFATTVLVTDYYDRKIPLPPHDIVFNSIGDADICGDSLAAASRDHCALQPAANQRSARGGPNRTACQCGAAARHSEPHRAAHDEGNPAAACRSCRCRNGRWPWFSASRCWPARRVSTLADILSAPRLRRCLLRRSKAFRAMRRGSSNSSTHETARDLS